ncbi:MAG TPA: sulfotransferase domain-containing protein [Terriglobales bacterium]|nr:sulfotransferase domain-containing protein [Terriglobales bacterium]
MLRWRARRASAAGRWGLDQLAHMPIVIGNAMPKSGSHLLIQVLLGLTNVGPFVDPGLPPLTRSVANRNLPEEDVLDRLHQLRSGDIAYAYLHAREPYLSELSSPSVAAFFVYRDPRDVIISQIFYAMEMYKGHGMHHYYTSELKTMEARIDVAINGVQTASAQLSPIRAKYERYLGWLNQPALLLLRFEDLILNRQLAIERILDHLAARGFSAQPPRPQAVSALQAAIAPRSSGTFRKGQPGEWKEHFTESNKQAFKASTGDLLQRLGYEKDTKW